MIFREIGIVKQQMHAGGATIKPSARTIGRNAKQQIWPKSLKSFIQFTKAQVAKHTPLTAPKAIAKAKTNTIKTKTKGNKRIRPIKYNRALILLIYSVPVKKSPLNPTVH